LQNANSLEFDENAEHLVIDSAQKKKNIKEIDLPMRKGAYLCRIKSGTLLSGIYKSEEISERHRHRYEFNNKYREIFEENGFIICGESPDNLLAEAAEIPANEFFLSVMFQPEFKSRPNKAHPIFLGFIGAALNK